MNSARSDAILYDMFLGSTFITSSLIFNFWIRPYTKYIALWSSIGFICLLPAYVCILWTAPWCTTRSVCRSVELSKNQLVLVTKLSKKKPFHENFYHCITLHNWSTLNNVIALVIQGFSGAVRPHKGARVEIPLTNRSRFERFERFSSKIWAVWAVWAVLEKPLKPLKSCFKLGEKSRLGWAFKAEYKFQINKAGCTKISLKNRLFMQVPRIYIRMANILPVESQ